MGVSLQFNMIVVAVLKAQNISFGRFGGYFSLNKVAVAVINANARLGIGYSLGGTAVFENLFFEIWRGVGIGGDFIGEIQLFHAAIPRIVEDTVNAGGPMRLQIENISAMGMGLAKIGNRGVFFDCDLLGVQNIFHVAVGIVIAVIEFGIGYFFEGIELAFDLVIASACDGGDGADRAIVFGCAVWLGIIVFHVLYFLF